MHIIQSVCASITINQYLYLMHKPNKINPEEVNIKIQKSYNVLNDLIQKATKQKPLPKNISQLQPIFRNENKANKIYIKPNKEKLNINVSANSYGISQQQLLTKKHISRSPQVQMTKFRIKDSLISKQQTKRLFFSEKKPHQQIYSPQVSRQKNHCQFWSIPSNLAKQYFSKVNITKQFTSKQIYQKFLLFLQQNNASIYYPMIKKYKNCVYFGEAIRSNQVYNGFIYFWKAKVYYGQLKNEDKHGYGKEINLIDSKIYQGKFLNGKKTGFFHVIKGAQTYDGQLVDGCYSGQGTLTTPLSQYKGQFQKGLRHGKGQQYFFHSRLILKGNFTNGKFQNDNSPKKEKKQIAKQLSQQELDSKKDNNNKNYKDSRNPMFCIHCQQYEYSIEASSFSSIQKFDDLSQGNRQQQFRDTVPKFRKNNH